MNTKLVESLVQVINSLSSEEKELLDEKLKPESNEVASAEASSAACDDRWEETLERIEARRKTIHARTGGKPFEPSVTEIIHQMREERDEQLMQACLPQDKD